MSTTLLERPRPTVARRQAASAPPPPRKPRPRPGRRVLPIALAVSAGVHVLVLALRFEVPIIPQNVVIPTRVIDAEVVTGMRVYDIVPVAADVPTPSPQIVPQRALDAVRPAPAPVQRSVDAAPAGPPATTTPERDPVPSSVAERLAPRAGDPLLWERPGDPLRPELDQLNNVRARVYGQIDAYNDSVAAAADAARRATDWTHRDANGDRWGVSPGKIHLGKVTLPLPFGFSAPPGRREEYNDRMREFNEIQQQAGRAEVEKTFEERVRAIRERADAKRDSTRTSGR